MLQVRRGSPSWRRCSCSGREWRARRGEPAHASAGERRARDTVGPAAAPAHPFRYCGDAARVVVSFALSVPVGVVIGIVIAESRFLSAVFKPLLFFLFSIPKSLFLPLFILAFGIGFTQKVAFGFVVVPHHGDLHRGRGRIDPRRPRDDRALVRRDESADRPAHLSAEHAAAADRGAAHLDDLHLHGRRAGRDVRRAPRDGYQISNWGETYQVRPLLAGVLLVSMMAILFNEAIRWVERRCGHWRT